VNAHLSGLFALQTIVLSAILIQNVGLDAAVPIIIVYAQVLPAQPVVSSYSQPLHSLQKLVLTMENVEYAAPQLIVEETLALQEIVCRVVDLVLHSFPITMRIIGVPNVSKIPSVLMEYSVHVECVMIIQLIADIIICYFC
jgi:hypothetical protein